MSRAVSVLTAAAALLASVALCHQATTSVASTTALPTPTPTPTFPPSPPLTTVAPAPPPTPVPPLWNLSNAVTTPVNIVAGEATYYTFNLQSSLTAIDFGSIIWNGPAVAVPATFTLCSEHSSLGLIYVSSPVAAGGGALLAIARTTGAIAWQLGILVAGSSLICTADTLIVQQPNFIFGVNPQTGAVSFQKYVNTTAPYSVFRSAKNGEAVVAYTDGAGVNVLVAATGAAAITAPLVLPQGTSLVGASRAGVLVASGAQGTFGYSIATGTSVLAWKVAAPVTDGDNETWVSVGASGSVDAFSATTGKPLWSWKDACVALNVTGLCQSNTMSLFFQGLSRPIVSVNTSALGVFGGFHALTGRVQWSVSAGTTAFTQSTSPKFIWYTAEDQTATVVNVNSGSEFGSGLAAGNVLALAASNTTIVLAIVGGFFDSSVTLAAYPAPL